MEREALPRLVLVADRFTEPAVAERVLAAVAGGVRWVHLRDHAAGEEAFSSAARWLVGRLRALDAGLRISINTRVDCARALGAGVHLGRRGPSVAAVRAGAGRDVLVGYSAHLPEEGRAAVEAGADYLFASPVFPTTSKPGAPGIGPEGLRAFVEVVPETPVFALGGITPARVAPCRGAGAYGVAVLSGILAAPDPAAAVQAYTGVL